MGFCLWRGFSGSSSYAVSRQNCFARMTFIERTLWLCRFLFAALLLHLQLLVVLRLHLLPFYFTHSDFFVDGFICIMETEATLDMWTFVINSGIFTGIDFEHIRLQPFPQTAPQLLFKKWWIKNTVILSSILWQCFSTEVIIRPQLGLDYSLPMKVVLWNRNLFLCWVFKPFIGLP